MTSCSGYLLRLLVAVRRMGAPPLRPPDGRLLLQRLAGGGSCGHLAPRGVGRRRNKALSLRKRRSPKMEVSIRQPKTGAEFHSICELRCAVYVEELKWHESHSELETGKSPIYLNDR
jgi:hypothetical protein